ncbi:unnamed protein product [Cunninghamella echinulata]
MVSTTIMILMILTIMPFIQYEDPECRIVMKKASFRNMGELPVPVTYRYFHIGTRILDNGRSGCPIENCIRYFSKNDYIFRFIKIDHLSEEEKIAINFIFPCTLCVRNPRFRDMNTLNRHYTKNFPDHQLHLDDKSRC